MNMKNKEDGNYEEGKEREIIEEKEEKEEKKENEIAEYEIAEDEIAEEVPRERRKTLTKVPPLNFNAIKIDRKKIQEEINS